VPIRQHNYGKTLGKKVLMDLGIMDIGLEPISGKKGVRISFKADSKITAPGDISISKGGRLGRTGKTMTTL